MKRIGLVLLSGGLDSTTVAAQATRQGFDLRALTVRYGQAHRREVKAAAEIARQLGIKHRLVDASFFSELAWYSSLTNPGRFPAPLDRAAGEMAADIPMTYVPLRNTLLLTLAAAFLESEVLYGIEHEGLDAQEIEAVLLIAANAIDYSGYPDCRPEYYRALGETLRLGSKLGTQYGIPLRVETPLIGLSKADIVRLAVKVRAPLELTWTCYSEGPTPCGRCDACLLRAKGFAEAGASDPALRRVSSG